MTCGYSCSEYPQPSIRARKLKNDGHRLLPSLERRASSYRVSHPSCFLRSRLASKPKMHLRRQIGGGLNRSDTRKRTQVLVLLALQVTIDNAHVKVHVVIIRAGTVTHRAYRERETSASFAQLADSLSLSL